MKRETLKALEQYTEHVSAILRNLTDVVENKAKGKTFFFQLNALNDSEIRLRTALKDELES
jgi:hypothetical protein